MLKQKLKNIRIALSKMLFNEYTSGDIVIATDGEIAEGKEVKKMVDGVAETLTDGDYVIEGVGTVTVVDSIVTSIVSEVVEDTVELEDEKEVETTVDDTVEEVVDNNAEVLAELQGQVAELVSIVEEVVQENIELRKTFSKFSKQPSAKSVKVEVKNKAQEVKGAARFFN